MKKTLLILAVVVLALLAWGFVFLSSAGSVNGYRLYGNQHHFVTMQAIWLAISIVPFCIAFFLDYHVWQRWPVLTILAYLGVCALLCAVFAFPATKGSHRWVSLGGSANIQPGELAKLMAVIATAVFLDRARWKVELFWKGAVPAAAIFGVLMGLVVLEPDFGSTMVIAITGVLLLLIAGVRFVHLGVFGLVGVMAVLPLLAKNANRMRRLLAWLPESWSDWCVAALHLPADTAGDEKVKTALHQMNQALIAIQNGGLFGVGLNKSLQKEQYLPEAHTDFIFAIGAEEWGLALSLLVLALFVALMVCGVMIAAHAPDPLGRMIAAGMTFILVFQALFNMYVVAGWAPTKGMALPFFSYGGTNLVTALTAVGMLFNVGRKIPLSNPQRRAKMSVAQSTTRKARYVSSI